MALTLYAHPFSSYCQKALIALYEAGTVFDYRVIGPDDPEAAAAWAELWPIRRMPLLVDGATVLPEVTVIVEYLDLKHPGPRPMLPKDPAAALEARLMDRVFDNYVMTPMQKFVFDRLRPEADRDAYGVAEAAALLERSYAWLDGRLEGRAFAAGADFGLADCAAAPSLFYADWVHPIDPRFARLRAYRARLLERPSVRRVIDEARPFRSLFPGGAPDRD